MNALDSLALAQDHSTRLREAQS